MLTDKGECLQQREQILQKKEVSCSPIYTYILVCQPEKGGSMLLHYVPQLALKSVNFIIRQLLISVDASFSSSEG